jgi:geranylgeranyl diphosphate synthase type I
MDIRKTLNDFAIDVDKEIERIFLKEQKTASEISSELTNSFPRLIELSKGGKKIRGALVYYSYLLHGGKDKTEILKVAAAIEIMHTFILIHDDIMDMADTRRGIQTLHHMYADWHRKDLSIGEPYHFGESMAITMGDLLNQIAYETIINTNFASEYRLIALNKLTRQIALTAYGQFLDIIGGAKYIIEEKDVLLIHELKTGIYTYVNPLQLGACLAGASEEQMKPLNAYAIPTGITYQIQDDILGLYGDEDKIGKSADSDIREGKKTLLVLKALERGTEEQKKVIHELLGKPDLTAAEAEQFRQIVEETKSIDYSKELAKKYITQAKEVVKNTPEWTGEGAEFLLAIADYMLNRQY